IVVPRFSSGFSALGCIVADMSYTQQQSVRLLSQAWDAARFQAIHDGMLETLAAPLRQQGHETAAIAVERTALVRYVGQSYAVAVPCAAPLDLARLGRDFRARHGDIYGYATDEHWELQSLRMRALVPRRIGIAPLAAQGGMPAPTRVAPCWFDPAAPHPTPRYDRERLPPDARIAG